MAKKESRRVETLSEFIEWAAQFNDGEYLFRGVSKDSYKIEASAYRRLITNKTAARLLKINQELIEKAKSLGHDQKNGPTTIRSGTPCRTSAFRRGYLLDRLFTQCLSRSLVCLPTKFEGKSKR